MVTVRNVRAAHHAIPSLRRPVEQKEFPTMASDASTWASGLLQTTRHPVRELTLLPEASSEMFAAECKLRYKSRVANGDFIDVHIHLDGIQRERKQLHGNKSEVPFDCHHTIISHIQVVRAI